MGRLFWKFFIAILLAQVGATVAIGGAFWVHERATRSAAPALESGPPAMIALAAAEQTLRHGGEAALIGLLGELRRPQVYVLDAQRRDLLGRPVPPELLLEAERELAAKAPRRARLLHGGAREYLAFASRAEPGAVAGEARRTRAGPLVPRPGDPNGRRSGHLIGIGAAVLASLLCAALLAWYFSRPIRALRSAFEAAASGNLAPRFAGATGRDELSGLGRDFDRMSGQLRTVLDGQRRLLHDVSHELRSPLARLQAAVGLAQQQPDKLAACLARIERESVRMDRLVGELLTLSRLEATPGVLRREAVDLAELVDATLADARFELQKTGNQDACPPLLALTGASDVIVNADSDLLASAIDNIVRNALHHAPGSAIEVRLGHTATEATIEVLDNGPGVPAAHLPAIFAPFYRAGAKAGNVDGHGLGLAIAQRVVHAHGGQIEARNRPQGGLAVRITLPAA